MTLRDPDALLDRLRIEEFLYREARLMDERHYDAWERLWSEDGIYWVPANGDDTDPTRDVSLIYDNRDRLRTRIGRLQSGKSPSQDPPPGLVRVVSNVEIEACEEGWTVLSTFHLAESRPARRVDWAGRTTHKLRREGDDFRIAFKKVVLVNNDQELSSLDFLV